MEEARSSARRNPVTTYVDDEDLAELERIARLKRAGVSQVAREFIGAGIERERRLQALDVAV